MLEKHCFMCVENVNINLLYTGNGNGTFATMSYNSVLEPDARSAFNRRLDPDLHSECGNGSSRNTVEGEEGRGDAERKKVN
jgi:hypothetical protein